MKYFLYALTLAFIVLKLTHFIDWSWFIVLSPIAGIICAAVLALILLANQKVSAASKIKPLGDHKSKFQQRMEEYQKANGKA